MSHVIKTLEKELQSLDTRIEQKRKSKVNLESQAHDTTIEIYQLQKVRDEIANALDALASAKGSE